MPGYSLFSNPRDAHGGGVAIYVKNVHSPTMLNELSLLEIEVETIFVEMFVDNSNHVIGCIYRPPGANVEIFLEKLDFLLSITRIYKS